MGCREEGLDLILGYVVGDYEVAIFVEGGKLGLGEPWGTGWSGHVASEEF